VLRIPRRTEEVGRNLNQGLLSKNTKNETRKTLITRCPISNENQNRREARGISDCQRIHL